MKSQALPLLACLSGSSESDDTSSSVSGNEKPAREDMTDPSEATPAPARSGNEKPSLAEMAGASEADFLLAIQGSGQAQPAASRLESDGEEWESMSEVSDSPDVGDVQLGSIPSAPLTREDEKPKKNR